MFSDAIARSPRRSAPTLQRSGRLSLSEWLLNGLLAAILFPPVLMALYRLLY